MRLETFSDICLFGTELDCCYGLETRHTSLSLFFMGWAFFIVLNPIIASVYGQIDWFSLRLRLGWVDQWEKKDDLVFFCGFWYFQRRAVDYIYKLLIVYAFNVKQKYGKIASHMAKAKAVCFWDYEFKVQKDFVHECYACDWCLMSVKIFWSKKIVCAHLLVWMNWENSCLSIVNTRGNVLLFHVWAFFCGAYDFQVILFSNLLTFYRLINLVQ